MEYKTIAELRRAGQAAVDIPRTRLERLQCWAAALERLGNRPLSTLWRTEHAHALLRDDMQAEGSPFTVAFDQPELRLAGLGGDTYGEARHFFGLSNGEMHWLVCYCHFGGWVSAATVAHRVRTIIARAAQPRLLRILRMIAGI
jgi:hypothetical protein